LIRRPLLTVGARRWPEYIDTQHREVPTMQHTYTHAVAVLLLALAIATPVAAETATIAKCQSLKDRIERYTDMRRKGGSASQMQQWKEQVRASEQQFKRLECKDHRRKLQ
jgi:hypothetical protein